LLTGNSKLVKGEVQGELRRAETETKGSGKRKRAWRQDEVCFGFGRYVSLFFFCARVKGPGGNLGGEIQSVRTVDRYGQYEGLEAARRKQHQCERAKI
jgi:hypothetical protein